MHEAFDTPPEKGRSVFFNLNAPAGKEAALESCARCDSTRVTHYLKDARPACGTCWYIEKISHSK